MFKYFSDEKAKKQELGADFVPSLQKLANEGLPPWASPEQYAAMLNELRDLAAQRDPAIPLHMIVDQEGDTSRDFARGGVVQFPSSMGLVAGNSVERAYQVAVAVSRQMKASGLDMIHSPVVDVNINPKNPEIGYRAYSDDPEIVAEYAIAQLKGFKENKVIAAAKHFPGRGDSATDAHHACPVLNVDADRFDKIELYPYKRLIDAGIDAIMVAHCLYPHIDPDQISTVSRRVVTGILRDQLGFEGMITTDSITMGALIDRYGIGEACARALDAGADIILMKAENRWRGEMFYTIRKWVESGRIKADELDDKVRRILAIKKQYGLFDDMGRVDASKAAAPYRDKLVVETSKAAAQHAILVARDELKALPLDRSKRVLLINQQYTLKTPNDIHDHPGLFGQLMESGMADPAGLRDLVRLEREGRGGGAEVRRGEPVRPHHLHQLLRPGGEAAQLRQGADRQGAAGAADHQHPLLHQGHRRADPPGAQHRAEPQPDARGDAHHPRGAVRPPGAAGPLAAVELRSAGAPELRRGDRDRCASCELKTPLDHSTSAADRLDPGPLGRDVLRPDEADRRQRLAGGRPAAHPRAAQPPRPGGRRAGGVHAIDDPLRPVAEHLDQRRLRLAGGQGGRGGVLPAGAAGGDRSPPPGVLGRHHRLRPAPGGDGGAGLGAVPVAAG